MTVVETRMSVWEALAGRAPGQPVGPADPGLWTAVAERLNPARARPRLRGGVEDASLTTVRGIDYVMLRSPDRSQACYLRLAPEEWRLARLMDGTRTVARLVADFARLSGRLAPDQVARIVADLAGNRMLDELPVDAFHPLRLVQRRPLPARLGRGLLAFARGRRVVLANIDPLAGLLYRAGGRLLFTRAVAILAGVVALAGLGLFGWSWSLGDTSVFLTADSYLLGAAVLLGLNIVALASHELGHALAAKHAGRRVPAAGFLLYFGIPSFFVDTTDVWMAGRRARIITTATGPATGLVLAGLAQVVGLLVPELAPWTFKLAFAWYINALFNLNPFLALDGYYLLMDWLEVPNLRARGLAWVSARLRGRPPRLRDLDREGRLVALYGILAVLWIPVAANIAYRVYLDRVSGLAIGLWHSGWPAQLLLVTIVAGLATPLIWVLAGWLGRSGRRASQRRAERRVAEDAPRRLQALRASALGRLSPSALDRLAEHARWVHPRAGEQLIAAGGAQSRVFVVVDGALEGRRPGDPTGTCRERVRAGGVVGLASAITGAPAALTWHTAGTTLLALPPHAVAEAVGPLPGPPPAEWAELEDLFGEAPALAQLSAEDRLGLLTQARPRLLAPGGEVRLAGPADAVVVASGVLLSADGERRRGDLIGPTADAGPLATARTPARVWSLPAVAGLGLLIGADRGSPIGGNTRPTAGVHPPADYPPLASPPGLPPSDVDSGVDRRFDRRLRWLILLLLLLALLLTGTNLVPGPAWAEMPSDRALLAVERGPVSARVDGVTRRLDEGDELYVREGDTVQAGPASSATLTFRGGGLAMLCAGTGIGIGRLLSSPDVPIQPAGALSIGAGRLLVDTQGTSRAFQPLVLRVVASGQDVVNRGSARFAVASGGVVVSRGIVTQGTRTVAPDPRADLHCGDGVALPVPAPTTTPPPPLPTVTPSPTPPAGPSPSVGPVPSTSTTTRTTTTRPNDPPGNPPPTTPPPTTPANQPPSVALNSQTINIDQTFSGTDATCNNGNRLGTIVVTVNDDRDGTQVRSVVVTWSGTITNPFNDPPPRAVSGSVALAFSANAWRGSFGPVFYPEPVDFIAHGDNNGGSMTIQIRATDSGGLSTTVAGFNVSIRPCSPVIIF